MSRDLRRTLTRTLWRARTWRPKRPGDVPVDIARLISPFRYDVQVRASLFAAIAERPVGMSDDAFVRSVADHPYAVWFREIEIRRFYPSLVGRQDAVLEGYRARVLQALATYRSFDEKGFDREHPITLRVCATARVSESGVLVAKLRHLGDGGHRLAVLHMQGRTLEPHMYRLDPRPFPVIDNTAVLVPALQVDPAAYARFLSATFLDTPVDSLAGLHAAVEATCPERVPELQGLLRAHQMNGGRVP